MTPPIPARGDGSVEALRKQVKHAYTRMNREALLEALDALCALVSTSRAEALEDTRRLDWLEENLEMAGYYETDVDHPADYEEYHWVNESKGDTLREAIDAAIRALSSSVPPGNER